ncbi:hypothetical protein D3C77_622440 [compost metagenome]
MLLARQLSEVHIGCHDDIHLRRGRIRLVDLDRILSYNGTVGVKRTVNYRYDKRYKDNDSGSFLGTWTGQLGEPQQP